MPGVLLNYGDRGLTQGFLPRALRSAQTRKHRCRNIFESVLLTMLYGCANGKEAKHFASETQILRLEDMLLGYANEETFGKH